MRPSGLEPGSFIGRYVVGRVLGEGAMGIVHEAYDPELDRTVAVKVLHARDETSFERRSRRLHREAQALAQLSHPNVVTVHDVGHSDGSVFVAMELVRGQTVRDWLKEERRSWQEVLDVFVAAARGLAAAHDQGLVHRDFKPANVMIADDGRILVMDFGLARVDDSTDASTSHPPAKPMSESPILEIGPTQDGPLVGTPAYISPEQHLGKKADARSDQFAFCVSLWEGLYGRRPFTGRTVAELMAKVLDGSPELPEDDRGVPGWLHAVVLRGLGRDPKARFTSMHALLAAIDSRHHLRARRFAIVALVASTTVAAVTYGVGRIAEHRRAAACERRAHDIEAVWSTNRRRSVHDGIASNESSYAAETADRVVAAIDVHANAWAEARKEACLAAEVREEPGWSEELYQRSLSCFDTRRSQLQSLLDQLDEADALTVQRAPFAVADLADPQLCADAEVVRTLPIPPPQSRAQVEAIMAELHRSTALRVVGSYGEAQTVAEQALQRADELGWAPLVARAEAQVGRVWVAAGNDEGARDILETAHYRALGASDYDTALRTAGDLAALYGVTLSDYAEGRSWLRHAETALSRLPDPAGLQRADIEATRGAILHAEAKYAESRQVKEAVLQQYTASLGAEHPQVAMALQSLANDDQVTGDYQRAEELYGRALEVFETALGPEHPEVAKTMANLALVEKAQGRYVEARERYEDALRLLEPALGPDHPDLGVVLTNLGLLLEEMGEVQEAKRMHERALKLAEQSGASPEAMATALHNVAGVDFTLGNYDESRAMFERVIGILERELGPRHPRIAAALQNLGLVADSQGDTRYAYDTYGRALEIVEEAVGPDHPTVADLLLNLASIDMAEERYDLGRQRLDRAIEIESAAFGPDHPSLMTSFNNVATLEYRRARYDEARPLYERARDICRAHPELDPRMCSYPLYGLARVALAQGRPDDALPLARRAFEMRVDTEASATELADVRFALAKALWETRTDRGRAVRLARQAADEYREEGTEPEALADVETWLRRHRHPT